MNDRFTAYEAAKRMGNETHIIVELMNTMNEMALDVPDLPCNRGEIHEVLLRDTYPKGEAHGFNMGVGSAASQTRTLTEGLMMYSQYAVVDKALADESGNHQLFRSQEGEGFIRGFGEDRAYYTIYGDAKKDPYVINGLYTRVNKNHIQKFKTAGATEKVTSIYICAAGKDKFHFIHSKNFGSVGIRRTDRGVQDWEMSNGKKRPAYVELFEMQFGIAIEHPDAVWRIANVPVTGMTATDREKLIDLVLETQDYLPPGTTSSCLYGNIKIKQLVEKAAREKQVVVLPEKDPWGNPVNLINGMRLRRMDVIKTDTSEIVS